MRAFCKRAVGRCGECIRAFDRNGAREPDRDQIPDTSVGVVGRHALGALDDQPFDSD